MGAGMDSAVAADAQRDELGRLPYSREDGLEGKRGKGRKVSSTISL